MNPLIRFVRGTVNVRLIGISSEGFLNFAAERQLLFRNLKEVSEIELCCTVFSSDETRLRVAAEKRGIEVVSEKYFGLPKLLRLAIKRPVFAAGLVLCAVLLSLLPRFVWTVQIEGNDTIPAEEIRRVMDDLGVHFGTDGRKIDSQMLKVRAMNEISALKWCAVNKKGGCVTILVSERDIVPEREDESTITNVIAARDGLITKTEIYGGYRRCRIGDAVKQGEVLISGVESFEKSTLMTHAYGEIYAMTEREITVKTPAEVTRKQYTGRVEKKYCLILGRKRINLSGNSRIPDANCDKIIRRSQLTLPGNYTFPVWLEEETVLYYIPSPEPLKKEEALERLKKAAEASVKDKMIAGKILAFEQQMIQKNGCWVLDGKLSCEEMIARRVPVTVTEGETDYGGTDH